MRRQGLVGASVRGPDVLSGQVVDEDGGALGDGGLGDALDVEVGRQRALGQAVDHGLGEVEVLQQQQRVRSWGAGGERGARAGRVLTSTLRPGSSSATEALLLRAGILCGIWGLN